MYFLLMYIIIIIILCEAQDILPAVESSEEKLQLLIIFHLT